VTFIFNTTIHVDLPGTAGLTKTTETKKEEFRKYLEKRGVLTQLTRALVSLYDETDKPENAIE